MLLLEICAVVASLAVVAIAVAAVRAMRCIEKATEQLSELAGDIRKWMDQASEFTREARETVASVREMIVPIRRVAERFGALGERTADLSAAVLEEVEPLLRTAAAVARGVKAGTALLEQLSHRFTHGRSATPGGSDSE